MRRTSGRFLPWPFRLRNMIQTRLFRLLIGRSMAGFGPGSKVLMPDSIEGAGNITIGRDVLVAHHALLAARPIEDGAPVTLEIGDGSRLGRNNHIYATRRIVLGRRVLTASNVYIADNRHGFEDPDVPVFEQPLVQLDPVEIGEGTWIGHGACIVGARIGRNCVIGAGAFVTGDIPDHSVVVGSPARIVRRHDRETGTWPRTPRPGTESDGALRDDRRDNG